MVRTARRTAIVPDMSEDDDDRALADAIIADAFKYRPGRLREAIENVARNLEAKGRSPAEIDAAIDELLDDIKQRLQTRH